jgi:hypothetical protein
MFIRNIHQRNGKISILIVENIRKNGKPIQKTLRHVATVPPEELDMFTEVAKHIMDSMENNQQSSQTALKIVSNSRRKKHKETNQLPVNLYEMREEQRIISGIHDIYGQLYDEIGFEQALKRSSVSKKIMKDIVMARLAKPCSKRASSILLKNDFGINIPIVKIYRMMDKLTEKAIETIQNKCWDYSKKICTDEIKVMFYDCTTIYFESFTEDELRCFGYSKDHKFNQGQILLALIVAQDGLPVGYEVFPGNTSEGKTMPNAIKTIKTRYKAKRIVIVADSGLLSKENRKLIENAKFEYILGARLKNLSKQWKNTIITQNNNDKLEKKKE